MIFLAINCQCLNSPDLLVCCMALLGSMLRQQRQHQGHDLGNSDGQICPLGSVCEKTLFQNLVASSMAKAKYTTKNIGHFGLAFSYYSHFTSPIRRYPDLLVHRILKFILKIDSFSPVDLEGLCKHCSETERNASLAERASFKYMQALYFKNKIGNVFKGKISGITEWGIYVALNGSGCEGLIKLSSMKDDHYIYNSKEFCLTGYSFNKIYQLGQNIKVKILKSDLERKQLYLSIINP